MKKSLLLTMLIAFLYSCGNSTKSNAPVESSEPESKVISNPTISQKPVSNCLTIESIELTNNSTVVKCRYVNDGAESAWVSPETFIRDCKTGKKYTITDVSGFPFSPKERKFSSYDEKVIVTMVFPKVPEDVETIDLIDEEDNPEGFNYYGIELK